MGTEHKLQSISVKIFYALFCFIFTVILGSIIFSNDSGLSPIIILSTMILYITLLLLIYHFVYKYINFIDNYYKIIIASGLILFFAVNIIMGCVLRFDPIYDLKAIFAGAIEWAETGSFVSALDYFYVFPHNLGGMLFLFVPLKIAFIFGITDYFAVAMIFNALLSVTTVFLVVLICKRLIGVPQSIMVLVCILSFLPFYMLAPVFYTDSLSMVFPVLIIYLYLRYIDDKEFIFIVLIGLSCVIGMLIKLTVLIALIAIIIHCLINKRIRSLLMISGISISLIIISTIIFNGYFYTNHMDGEKAKQLNVPYSHWIMMGLEGDGKYNPSDYDFTFSFDNKEEQKSAIANRIKERIESRGLLGMLDLFVDKEIVVFGDGTLAQSDFLDDNPVNDTLFHSFVLYGGDHYTWYKYICDGAYFSIQLLMLISAYYALLRRGKVYDSLLPLLCIFGAMSFFMVWEVSGRYITNFVPMMFIAAMFGLNNLETARKRLRLLNRKEEISNTEEK